MRIKKILLGLTAATIAVTTSFQCAVTAYAAPLKTKFISEIKSIRGMSAEDAKQKFEAAGYTMLETNVNPTLDGAVYIGYKTSMDINDAITGLNFMNMGGQYSFSQYEQVLRDHRDVVDHNIDRLVPTIEAYRKNYRAGTENALHAYDMLNKVFDFYSDEYMGDFLLECSLESGNREPLVGAMMKGNAGIVQGIQRLLALAASDESNSWLERMEDTTLDDLIDEYMVTYATPKRATSAMGQDFGEDALIIRTTLWDDLYTSLQGVENEFELLDDGNYNIDAMFADIPDDIDPDIEVEDSDTVAFINRISAAQQMIDVYETLQNYEYDGESLLDFFNRPSDQVEVEEIYPMLSVMTDAQRGTLSASGLVGIILNAERTDDWEEERSNIFSAYENGVDESISLYMDVNLHAFEDGVAMTSAATQRDVSGYSFFDVFCSGNGNTMTQSWTRVWAFAACTAIGLVGFSLAIIAKNIVSKICIPKIGREITSNVVSNQIKLIFNENVSEAGPTKSCLLRPYALFKSLNGKSGGLSQMGGVFGLGTFFMRLFIVILFVCHVFIILSIVATVAAAVSMIFAKGVIYDKIPAVMCDAWQGEEFGDYIFYDAVQGLDPVNMEYGDMNGYDNGTSFAWNVRKGWLVLYYTKDKRVGEPLTELKLQTGSNKAPLGYEGVTIFGQGNVTNLTATEYTGQSDDPKIYLFCKRGGSSLTGTVQTNGIYITVGTISLLLGVALGAWLGTKRKREPEVQPVAG